ncbi:MAG: hypothetical protein D6725_00210 [Planctomycetota bacterium]|nr:MAG: hypothetical protein D6725_00210 [Planctomycetota bacterium]
MRRWNPAHPTVVVVDPVVVAPLREVCSSVVQVERTACMARIDVAFRLWKSSRHLRLTVLRPLAE